MTLTIIIPAYNEERNLASVLDSVMQVELPYGADKEIIVVDDGSADDTVSRVQSFIAANPQARINLIRHTSNPFVFKNVVSIYLLCRVKKMEHTGFEPVTSTLPVLRAPSCANAPYQFS